MFTLYAHRFWHSSVASLPFLFTVQLFCLVLIVVILMEQLFFFTRGHAFWHKWSVVRKNFHSRLKFALLCCSSRIKRSVPWLKHDKPPPLHCKLTSTPTATAKAMTEAKSPFPSALAAARMGSECITSEYTLQDLQKNCKYFFGFDYAMLSTKL